MELAVLSPILGAIAGLAVSGAWWAVATILSLSVPSDMQLLACVILGAVIAPMLVGALFIWLERTDGRT